MQQQEGEGDHDNKSLLAVSFVLTRLLAMFWSLRDDEKESRTSLLFSSQQPGPLTPIPYISNITSTSRGETNT